MCSEAVSVRGLSHAFGAGDTARQALADIDLDIPAGLFVMLMGPSGCGKTTALTLIGALRAVQCGSLRTLGTELAGADEATRTRVRRRIGFVHQGHNLHASLTAAGNVRMALEVRGGRHARRWPDWCAETLAAVGLGDRTESYPAELSTGQKQRVAIARALVARPQLVLADEPTAALDRGNGRQAVQLLRDLAREAGTTVLMVTHDNRILDLADRIIAMDDGRIVHRGGDNHDPPEGETDA
jgi:putative ABC transport system ATP-binding protein